MQVFGHRGSPGFPRFGENTRTSFRRALDAGAAGFELDVRRCGDRTITVIHDATLDRTTNGSGALSQFTFDQLSRLDAGHGDSVPRLIDILNEFGNYCTVHVELKESGIAADLPGMPGSFAVSAFDSDDNDGHSTASWNELASIASALPVAPLITRRKFAIIGNQGFIAAARKIHARAIHPPRDVVNAELIAMARDAGLPVRVWTINDPAEAIRLRELGVDAIFSDCPDVCIKALSS
jgi:glycerophosphoryl diester phosphodiesterase